MIDQTIIVKQFLKELNQVGISTFKVESELPISHGYLYKVTMGHKTLGEDKLLALQEYHAKQCKRVVHKSPAPLKPTIILAPKKEMPKAAPPKMIEIKSTPVKKEVKPGSLADMMKAARSESGRAVAQPYKRVK